MQGTWLKTEAVCFADKFLFISINYQYSILKEDYYV